jgi:hypothetical protein
MTRQIFALAVFAASVLCAGQDQPQAGQTNQPPVGQTDQSQTGTTEQPAAPVEDLRAPAPALLGGDSGSLAFTSELERSNYIRGGIAVSATYDDNASNGTTDRIGDFSYSILPNIQLDQTRSRLHWILGYSGGFTANQRLTSRNQGSHNLNGSLAYRLSPHMDLRLSDSFLDTTGLLQQFQNGIGTPVAGPVNQPNPTLITPLAKNLNNTANVDWSYQFSRDNVIGAGGTFYDAHFHDLPAGAAPLLDTETRSADFYLNHRFTARNWTGITYRFQRLTVGSGANLTDTHSLLLSHTIYLREHMTLSFYAGPEYSEINSVTVTANITPPVISFATVSSFDHQTSISGGGTFGWQGRLTSIRLEASRKVSDGGGVVGAVVLNSVEGGIRRQLTQTTAVNLNALYGHNRELGSAAGGAPLTSATGTVGLEQRMGASLMLRLDYGRDYQTQSTNVGSINHNRGTVSVAYSFTRPMGR